MTHECCNKLPCSSAHLLIYPRPCRATLFLISENSATKSLSLSSGLMLPLYRDTSPRATIQTFISRNIAQAHPVLRGRVCVTRPSCVCSSNAINIRYRNNTTNDDRGVAFLCVARELRAQQIGETPNAKAPAPESSPYLSRNKPRDGHIRRGKGKWKIHAMCV